MNPGYTGNLGNDSSPVRPVRKQKTGRIATALLAVATIAVLPFVLVTSAQAATHTFLLDSLDTSRNAGDTNTGDGVCQTAAGTCTMRAAMEESNALNLAPGAVLVTPAEGFSGNIDVVNTSNTVMNTARVSNQDAGAHFEITAPVVIDLQNRVTMESSSDTARAMFHVNSSDVELLNMSQVLSGESSYVMGPSANNVTIDGGTTITQKSYYAERFVVLREGAKNISVKNYRVQGFYHYQDATGIFYINAQNNTPIENIVIDNVHITYTVGGSCHGSDGSGCRTDVLAMLPRNQNVVIDGFEFVNSSVANILNQAGFPFSRGTAAGYSAKVSNITISNNEFINVQGLNANYVYRGFINMPYGKMAGTNTIENNQFVRDTIGQGLGVVWDGNTTSGSAGDLTIRNNYFNGYNFNSIYLKDTGNVLVEKNTFGARSGSQNRPAIAEETRDGGNTLIENIGNANGRVNTWYPTSDAAVLTGAMPSNAVIAESPLGEEIPQCVATLKVAAPTTAPVPEQPLDLDVYWTQERTAEVYLGRASAVTGSDATVMISLPVGEQSFPSTVVGQSEQVTIVNEDSGQASGYVRLQTISTASGQSSQLSRLVGFTGNCRPELTLNQAADENDRTLGRDLHYTLESSLPLDPATVTKEIVDVTAVGITETIDAARLNPRSVRVDPVPGSENRTFTVIARVDDSAEVTAKIGAEQVTGPGGLTNREPAKSTDADITFMNPITTQPSRFTLVTGEPDGKQYRFELDAGAPQPSEPLRFSSVLERDGVDIDLDISSMDPTIEAGKMSSERVTVIAGAGEVIANTPVRITHEVTSADSNYDGLVVRPSTIRLFSTDPSIQITKRAFVDATEMDSPEQIMATGTEALRGTRLTDGQPVCFVYNVTNISQDDWATTLTDISVVDTDKRLGENGVIGEVPVLGVGESTLLSSCAALIPEDTTVSESE